MLQQGDFRIQRTDRVSKNRCGMGKAAIFVWTQGNIENMLHTAGTNHGRHTHAEVVNAVMIVQ